MKQMCYAHLYMSWLKEEPVCSLEFSPTQSVSVCFYRNVCLWLLTRVSKDWIYVSLYRYLVMWLILLYINIMVNRYKRIPHMIVTFKARVNKWKCCLISFPLPATFISIATERACNTAVIQTQEAVFPLSAGCLGVLIKSGIPVSLMWSMPEQKNDSFGWTVSFMNALYLYHRMCVWFLSNTLNQ